MAKKLKPQQPDEVFSRGPLTMARFGKNVILEANWEEEEFDKFQKHLIESYPKVVRDIEALVSEIKDIIKVLPPEKLLHRAWGEMAGAHMNIESESEVGEEEAISLRMIDYVQSVIAAVPPAEDQRDDVTDEEWKKLRSKIKQLFRNINNDYLFCRNAKNRSDDPNLDVNFEKFQSIAQLYWCNVRGERYPVDLTRFRCCCRIGREGSVVEKTSVCSLNTSSVWTDSEFGNNIVLVDNLSLSEKGVQNGQKKIISSSISPANGRAGQIGS